MKKNYEKPLVSIIQFSSNTDVILVSDNLGSYSDWVVENNERWI